MINTRAPDGANKENAENNLIGHKVEIFYDLQLLKARVDVEDNMAMSPSPPYRGDSREGNFLPLSYIWTSCCVDLPVYFSSFVRAVSYR